MATKPKDDVDVEKWLDMRFGGSKKTKPLKRTHGGKRPGKRRAKRKTVLVEHGEGFSAMKIRLTVAEAAEQERKDKAAPIQPTHCRNTPASSPKKRGARAKTGPGPNSFDLPSPAEDQKMMAEAHAKRRANQEAFLEGVRQDMNADVPQTLEEVEAAVKLERAAKAAAKAARPPKAPSKPAPTHLIARYGSDMGGGVPKEGAALRWIKVGAAFLTTDGNWELILDVIPVNFNGRLILEPQFGRSPDNKGEAS